MSPSERQSPLVWLGELWRAQRELPPLLRFHALVPLTVVLVTVLGMVFTLPTGPLCYVGMVLFWSGGCDWGGSNIFFYSKVGLLLVANGAFGFCLARRPRVPRVGFLPHLALLLVMAWLLRSDAECATYYGHPNGSEGQMCLELAAFSAWGVALLGFLEERPTWMKVLALPLWNAVHVGVFYAGLGFTPHWTWTHTAFVAGSQALLAGGVWILSARRRRTPAREQLGLSL